MTAIGEIESAIQKRSAQQVDELAIWLEAFRTQRTALPPVEKWLQRAKGAALSGITTAEMIELTRGDE